MSEWKTYKLGEIASKIGSGATPRGGKESYLESGEFLLVRSQNVLDFSFSKSGLAFISKDQANGLKNVELEENDVLLNITGDSVARVCQVPNDILPARVNQHVAIIRGESRIIDQAFLKYYLLQPSFKKYMLGLASAGATRNALTKSMIENFEIATPSLPDQRRIAAILSSLDDKIELNLQMNQTLEAIAQALFKEWFVDFNFPGFDGELVDGLPRGWKYKTIRELGRVITGNTPSSKNPDFFGEVTPFVTPTDFKNFGKLIIGSTRCLSDAGRIAMKTRLLPKNSIIVTCIGSDMGKIAINAIECVTNQQINSIVPIDNRLVDYLYYDLICKYDYLRNIATGGSTMPIINKSRFEEIEILTPSFDILEEFQSLMDGFNSKTEENIRQSQSLAQLRDTLLPRLMSGQIEIGDV